MFRKNNLKKILPYFVAFAGLALSFIGLVFWTFFVPDPAIWICNLDDWRSCYEDQEVVEEILIILALFVFMVFHLLLCYGFIKKRPNFVIPWMVLNVIFFAYFLKHSIMEIFVKGPYPTMLLGFYQDLCALMISIIVGSAVSDYNNNLENLRKILPYFVALAGLALSFVGLVFWTFFVPDPVIWICHLDDWESCYEDKGVVEEILMILALFVMMVFHLLLCYGFIKKRPNFVIPWMVLNVIFFAYFLKQSIMEIFVNGPFPNFLLEFYQDLCPLLISIIVGSAVSDYKTNLENFRFKPTNAKKNVP